MAKAKQTTSDFKGDHLSVHMAACTGDVKCVFDAAMTAGSNVLHSDTAHFAAADAGKLVKVYNAGLGQFSPHLYGKIRSVTDLANVLLMTASGADLAAERSVTGAQAFYGTDYTAQFQGLLDAGSSLYIPFGAYGIVGPLTVKPGVRVYGQCKGAGVFSPGGSGPGTVGSALGSCVVNFSDSAYAFEYLSDATPGQIQDGFLFERMTILSKRGIRLNDPTVAGSLQSYLHPAMAQDVLFQGDYDYPNDPQSFTATLPTAHGSPNSLDQYGVGFAGRKLLRCEIKDCTFYNYGVSVWMSDWSQSSVRHSRLVHGGVFIWVGAAGFDSNRNKIINNEIIEFSRKGAIYIEYALGLLIQANWFEQNSAVDLSWLTHGNPTYIWSDFDDSLEVSENLFLDNYSLSAPLYRLSPRIPALVFGNAYASSGLTKVFALVDLSHFLTTNPDWSTAPVKMFGNSSPFPVPVMPGVVPLANNNFYRVAYDSPANIAGSATASEPWVVSAVTGDWVIRTNITGFTWLPPIASPADRYFRCAVTARWLGGSTFFCAVYLFAKVANIIGMSSTAPIVVETAGAHGLSTADYVFIKDILAVNFLGFPGVGISQVTVIDPTHFSLDGSDGATGGTYRQGGEVYKRSLLNVFNPEITNTARLEPGYFQFAVPESLAAKFFLGIDTNNDRAEIFSIELVPMERVAVRSGPGTPETFVVAPVGSLYLRTDGGAGTTLYVKESGVGAVGWVGK